MKLYCTQFLSRPILSLWRLYNCVQTKAVCAGNDVSSTSVLDLSLISSFRRPFELIQHQVLTLLPPSIPSFSFAVSWVEN